ncbi:MAG: hypothetical protein ACYDCC_09925 [Actinomycetota bacterium]
MPTLDAHSTPQSDTSGHAVTNRIGSVRRLAFVVPLLTLLFPIVQRAHAAADPIADLLKRRSDAISSFDSATFEQTMELAPAEYKDRERTWLRRLRALPLRRYDLLRIDDEYGDLARPKDKQGFDEVHVLQTKERISLSGYDAFPTNEDVFLTIARKGSVWSVIGDESVEDLGLLSMRNLWDFGDIETQASDGVLVVFHPSESSAIPTIMNQVKLARARVQSAWPYGLHLGIVVMVPTTVPELTRILQTTFDLSGFVAFTVSSVNRDTGFHLVGNRIYLHWPNFRQYPGSFQTQLLAHELTHLATRDMGGPYHTPMIDEGVAQFYGEGGGHVHGEIAARIASNSFSQYLVPNWSFYAGPDSDIRLAYEEAASFMKFLASRFGNDAGARVYKQLAAIDPVSPGTWRYHLDTVLEALFHEGYASIEHDWYGWAKDNH